MEYEKLIQELNKCAATCNMCYTACLNEEEVNMMTRCIELDRECADVCQLTASILTRGSENAEKYLALCAEICLICAEECGKHEHDHCKKCAEECQKCAESCQGEID